MHNDIGFESWDIKCYNSFGDNFTNFKSNTKRGYKNTYLLNTSKESFNYIEKIVYDLSKFHLNRLNIELNDVYIEFWFKHVPFFKELHVDTDEYERFENDLIQTPFLSCVTYLNDNLYPTIVTNLECEHLYEDKNNKANMIVSFPKKFKHITFDGGRYYHGALNVFNNLYKNKTIREVITINLWFKKPTNVLYFENFDIKDVYKKEDITIEVKKNNIIKSIECSSNLLNKNLFKMTKDSTTPINNNFLVFEHLFKNENLTELDTFLLAEI